MMYLNSTHGDVAIYAETVEQDAISQVLSMANSPLGENAHIRIMPDCHAGAGCVIGTTMLVTDKVCPNLVGVDIGCTDENTEILTPDGWIKIKDYEGQNILVYDKFTDTAFFDKPLAYIKLPCDKFYHFYSNKGLDQMLSAEHKMLIWHGYKGSGYTQTIGLAKDVFDNHNQNVKSNKAIKTTFCLNQAKLPVSDDMIRILVMISADGRVRFYNSYKETPSHNEPHSHIELHLKKKRKIERAKMLLDNAKMTYNEYVAKDSSTCISFTIPYIISKSLQQFYNASKEQLAVLAEEIYHWDGTYDVERNHKNFSTTDKINADVVQFAHAVNGVRAGICASQPSSEHSNWNVTYNVYETQNEYVGFPAKKLETVECQGAFKYCFTTTTGFFVMRRNDCITITGNCGVDLVKTNIDFSSRLEELDAVIRKHVPHGMEVHEKEVAFPKLDKLLCWDKLTKEVQDRAKRAMGTLGGGNHFIEAYKDGGLAVHSGSRNIGLAVAKYYQKLAEQRIAEQNYKVLHEEMLKIEPAKRESWLKEHKVSVATELSYLTGQDMQNYLHDVAIMQEFANQSRFTMLNAIVTAMGGKIVEHIQSIHNYIDLSDETCIVLRKGAISAKEGEVLVIPLNMRDGMLVCKGKGNPEWNYSAPHGAGRLYSRSKAKELFSVEEYTETMAGIFSTCISENTIDEAPFAYKDYEEIMRCVEPTVEILERIVPIYNFKAN